MEIMPYINAMTFNDVNFYVILIKVTTEIGPFHAGGDTDTTINSRYTYRYRYLTT